MLKKIGLAISLLLLTVVAVAWVKIVAPFQSAAERFGPEGAARDYALQDDKAVPAPPPQQSVYPAAPNSEGNLYWGELHLHTAESFDASLFGTTLGIEDAYRFARGEALKSPGGERMQLSRPLDFVAITDHAEGFGTRSHCGDEGLSVMERAACWLVNEPNPFIFRLLVDRVRGEAPPGDPSLPAGVYQQTKRTPPQPGAFPSCRFGEHGEERCYRNAKRDWRRYVELADRYNEPGKLTTLIGYEYSPGLPDQGKHHRNVIFRSSNVPERALSSFDVPNAIELWKGLDASCVDNCEFLTIPHNSNKAWGLTYSRYTWDGQEYSDADWRLRMEKEPLAEIYQIKGAQECALGVGATDEECAFGQVFEPCEPGETTGCAFRTGFVRQGLKVGLELDQALGFNPLRVGFVAATDSHNANPGDVEEWDFPGAVGSVTSPAIRRLTGNARAGNSDNATPEPKPYKSQLQFHTSGGLAAVWAPENTREAIFDALARRETYATSGPRIALRFYARSAGTEGTASHSLTDFAAHGVPMGSILRTSSLGQGQVMSEDYANSDGPEFFVWAASDPLDAPLQRIQMVKGWIDEGGQTHERVVDIACADGQQVNPGTGRCPDNGASVDLNNCRFSEGSGARELKTVWRDPDFQPNQSAFYYVRVLMNPTCRWSTYDAIRLGRAPDPRVPATIRERAWTSPIWIEGSADQ